MLQVWLPIKIRSQCTKLKIFLSLSKCSNYEHPTSSHTHSKSPRDEYLTFFLLALIYKQKKKVSKHQINSAICISFSFFFPRFIKNCTIVRLHNQYQFYRNHLKRHSVELLVAFTFFYCIFAFSSCVASEFPTLLKLRQITMSLHICDSKHQNNLVEFITNYL